MAESLDNFAVLFRHVLLMLGRKAFRQTQCVRSLADALQLMKVLMRILNMRLMRKSGWNPDQ
jgi:hypothetical protein